MAKEEFQMPKTFKDGEFGFVPCVMLGGPIDGKRYKLPILPGGAIPDGLGHPLQEPHETSPYANYERAGDEMIGGFYVFIYKDTRSPNGERMAEETPEATGAPSTQNTCEGYGSNAWAANNSEENK